LQPWRDRLYRKKSPDPLAEISRHLLMFFGNSDRANMVYQVAENS
jgi:hypothetical protein